MRLNKLNEYARPSPAEIVYFLPFVFTNTARFQSLNEFNVCFINLEAELPCPKLFESDINMELRLTLCISSKAASGFSR